MTTTDGKTCLRDGCGHPIYYGLYCSNICSDSDYALWKARRRSAHLTALRTLGYEAQTLRPLRRLDNLARRHAAGLCGDDGYEESEDAAWNLAALERGLARHLPGIPVEISGDPRDGAMLTIPSEITPEGLCRAHDRSGVLAPREWPT